MIQIFTAPGAYPFAIALAVVAGLFCLELLSALLGGSLFGLGSDGPDIDVDAEFDLAPDSDGALADLQMDLESDLDGPTQAGRDVTGGLFTWIGARDVPFLIWLVSFLAMFGLFGLLLQSGVNALLATTLPAGIAALIVFPPALGVTRVIANWVALIMPKTETAAVKARHLGGLHGVITQGTASEGRPAEVKIRDRHGNTHYLRVEPLHSRDVFPAGSEVTLIRKRGDKFYVI